MNLIPMIVKELGVEIGEEFRIKDESGIDEDFHRFTDCRLEYYDQAMCEWQESARIIDLIDGRAEVVKKPFEPKHGEEFYKVCVAGGKLTTCVEMWANYLVDYALKYCGNCFRTEKEAEAHKYEIYEKLTWKKWKEVGRMSEKNIMGGWDKAIKKIIDREEVGRIIKPIKEPRIGQHNCHGGDKTDCKRILKERCDFMYRNIDELEDGECIVLKVVVYNQGGKMQMVNEKELREYEKGTDFFDILADPKLLCLYDDGE